MGTKGIESAPRLEPNTLDDIGSLVVQFREHFGSRLGEHELVEITQIIMHIAEMAEAQWKAATKLYLLSHKCKTPEGWESIGDEMHGWASALEGR